jgi:hypothetical protein
MTDEPGKRQTDLDSFLRRERLFRRFTWLATFVPIALFILFLYLTAREIRKYEGFRDENAQLQSQIAGKKADLDALNKTLADKEFALEVARQNNSGPHPYVRFYRAPVADQIKQALGQSGLGFNVDPKLSDYPGNPALKDKTVDTLEYGCGVTSEDIRAIGLALLKGNLPLRRIAPAVKLKDPMLVQYIASMHTDSNKESLSLEQIQQWTRPTKPCPVTGRVTSSARAPL